VPERRIPAPVATPETAAFWQAARAGLLLLPRCRNCGRLHWYPRAFCPYCFSGALEQVEASGDGTIHAFSVMRRTQEPYAIAYVALAEGPIMLTNLVACDFDRLRIGQPVRLVWSATEGGPPVPTFTPV
jgi:hypothetical protein